MREWRQFKEMGEGKGGFGKNEGKKIGYDGRGEGRDARTRRKL